VLPVVTDFIASMLVGNGAAPAELMLPAVKAPANAQTIAVLTILMAVLHHRVPAHRHNPSVAEWVPPQIRQILELHRLAVSRASLAG
jgi:hypothetical protein